MNKKSQVCPPNLQRTNEQRETRTKYLIQHSRPNQPVAETAPSDCGPECQPRHIRHPVKVTVGRKIVSLLQQWRAVLC
jgi:hypothetical protein